MSAQQVVFQYLSAGSNTLTVPAGFSNQVLVYAWGAGGGAGYSGGGGGDEYQRTVRRNDSLGSLAVPGGGTGLSSFIRTETITVSPGVIPPPGVSSSLPSGTVYGDWIKTSSASPDSRAFGGGGGFVEGIITVSSGDTVVISVGGQGGVGPRDGSGIGGIGDTPAISFNGGTSGVGAPTDHNDDQNYGAGGGGGGATSVLVNGVPMIVAAGGGGGGGGRSYQTGSAGTAGGVATLTSTTPRGGTSPGGYSVGGAGGAGYPFGGAGGQTFGDDAGAATGGYGGQNYANASVTSSTLTAGSGITPGGATNALYPKAKRGYAGYDGAVIVIFTKSFQAYVKDTTWKEATNAWVKAGTSSTTSLTPVSRTYTTAGNDIFTVPSNVTSLTVTATGGSGGGSGSSGSTSSGPLSVTPRSLISLTVGAGGVATESVTTTYTSTARTTYTVPAGVTSITISATGGRGGSGGDNGPIYITTVPGSFGSTVTQTIAVSAGDVIAMYVGGTGGGGEAQGLVGQTISGAGSGGTSSKSSTYNGRAGSQNTFGSRTVASGGGGASTVVELNGSIVIEAAGGRGGGGELGGSITGGAGGPGTGTTGSTAGQITITAPRFATSGGTSTFGSISAAGGAFGVGAGTGSAGSITVNYSVPEIINSWKPITRAWIKADDLWKPIQSDISLVPIPSTAEIITINLNIAANANNYVLSDFLSGTSYYPGRSIVNLTVDAGVIVGSSTVGTPALIIDGLTTGDLINLINNGNIAGAGGQGGAAGSYTSVTSGGSSPSKGQSVAPKGGYSSGTTTVTSVPGRPGEIGGSALYVTYATNLVNNGTIAGGGGGGGGGGGPTGGQGGGGAGRKAGSGANNGTLTAGGAGTGLGGAGGARGTAGSAGTNDTNAGGLGGAPGAAILGVDLVTITTAGTIIGERKVIAREVG